MPGLDAGQNKCAPVVFDTLCRHQTPEGLSLDLPLAGPVARALAMAIDTAIRGVVYLALTLLFSRLGGVGTAAMLIGFFLLEWLYPVPFEVVSGATPGKKAMGLMVVQDNGAPVTLSASLLRNLLRGADFLPFFYGVGLVTMLANGRFQRLGDIAAGTLVVYRPAKPVEPAIAQAAPKQPPTDGGRLTTEELRQFVAFAERIEQFSPQRRVELAETLLPVTGLRGEAAVGEILAYANWLVRSR